MPIWAMAMMNCILYLSIVNCVISQDYSVVIEGVESQSIPQVKSILQQRFVSYGYSNVEIKSNQSEDLVEVTTSDLYDGNTIRALILTPGKLEFCETLSGRLFIKYFSGMAKHTELLDLLNHEPNEGAILGHVEADDTLHVMQILSSESMPQDLRNYRYAWGRSRLSKDHVALYALKNLEKGDTFLPGKYVKEARHSFNKFSKRYSILLSFNPEGTEAWAKITKRNIDQSIAIVFDNKVYSAPRVRAAITGGNAEISGNIDENEAKELAAIIQGGTLPAKLKMKE